ncbi:zinc finger protein 622-like [Acanthaster planci]|uniref:Zinc finger protein 622-like n=1 Tax=Acanthaster planci TaxID=133434 RepID=A0A8B7XG23_ACAPL|nr:zinc finger protein 622-like [Acanthaster planci]XP_022079729.1 zinc finger protein 622-like [Acanthaster planci]
MSSLSFTCISCRVAFASADLQRAHYKSDWHRYNLKRKLAEMVPVTAEEFKQRVLDKQAQASQAQQDSSSSCQTCGKHFSTGNAFTNHMQSKKHRETEARIARQREVEVEKRNAKNREKGLDSESTAESKDVATENKSVDKAETSKTKIREKRESLGGASSSTQDVEMADDDDEWEEIEGEPITTTDCLFCSHTSQSVEKNCSHMTRAHSFFLPNVEYVCDLEGLLAYLGEKVGCGFMCLWCNDRGRTFYSLDAVQRHMRDKGHCKLQYEGDIIYEYADFYDFRKSYPDHARGGETEEGVAGDSDDDEVDDSALQIQQEGYELVLPSGARIGHRELHRYFRQNVPPVRQIVKCHKAVIGRIMTQYRALGWSGNKGEAAQKQIRDMRYFQKFRSRKDLHLSMKANKMQPHLRPQVIF